MKVIPREQHCVSRKDISQGALRVMARLRDEGHQAYLVGGAVRDLLLGNLPKDFDVATDATPEEVRAAFRNSRIIGRRFRIVHVRQGREIIEVTTFRGHHDEPEGSPSTPGKAQRSSRGLLLRDNVYGTLEDDALRRDLTVNALYYDSGTFEVLDHVNGTLDLAQRCIRVIGDPWVRYREDPVRMLRTVRFAAKLQFTIHPDSCEPIRDLAPLLDDIPAARLFDEFGKLFLSGNGEATLQLLNDLSLQGHLFPETAYLATQTPLYASMLECTMRNTDERIRQGKPVTPAFTLAAILWPAVNERRKQLENQGEHPIPSMHSAGQEVVAASCQRIAIPKRFSLPMREIWDMQLRLGNTRGKKVVEQLKKRRFRAAYDFILLREQAGEDMDGLGKFWTELQEQHPVAQHDPDPSARRRPRRRGGRQRGPRNSFAD
ncbi:MAG: polynucleotide adenylyltransferase PcnB [Pseudomonadota bacterium]